MPGERHPVQGDLFHCREHRYPPVADCAVVGVDHVAGESKTGDVRKQRDGSPERAKAIAVIDVGVCCLDVGDMQAGRILDNNGEVLQNIVVCPMLDVNFEF